jgi:hypothetical protein
MSKRTPTAPFHHPRAGRIPTATAYSGLGRSSLYRLAAVNPGLFKKNGSATIVDFDVLDQILNALPEASIKPNPRT